MKPLKAKSKIESPSTEMETKKPGQKRTAFEAAETPRERLELTSQKPFLIRPVHPTEVHSAKKKFLDDYGFSKDEVDFYYDEIGMSLTADW